ncbi:MAG: exodeoxyribonuclease VII small subunit [Deltaproteobacteria bacterium]|jgi:exodeoxyribonuclease VII small subunit|nr:exodeoxyribonuclease VII small subunit [Deltaproteobacteria bacterium]
MDPDNATEETFEEGLAKLEGLVAVLENQDVSLDEAIKAFEAGAKLSRLLSDKLTKAEARLETLVQDAEGLPVVTSSTVNEDDYEFDDEDEDAEADE